MMKYVINHPSQMAELGKPFFLGFMLWFITLATEVLTVVYLSTIGTTIDVIIK